GGHLCAWLSGRQGHSAPSLCHQLLASPQISGKWFYLASAFHNPEFNQSARTIQAAFFYFTPNPTDDTILLGEYLTIGNKCIYNSSYLKVQRENGTLSKYESGKEVFVDLLLTKDPKIFMLGFSLKDEQNKGLSLYADKAEVTEEQMRVFHEAITCFGMRKSEINYTDAKKDLCGPLEKQHKEERQKEKEEHTALD
ncbi:alpha-1-acid glycoprotein 1-like, partial [Mustela nigripes]|uniref:alpha-1-acid glycoprotein 1-like n=1 Tax=Mustela nigripes TaxID=77151 RepID=UPI0028164034